VAFGKVKEDTEGIKNEIAFALKRIAKLEEVLTKLAIENPDFGCLKIMLSDMDDRREQYYCLIKVEHH
jgi:hypothetical protein